MFIPYTNENFVFSGFWQENGNGEIVNYKTAAFFEIGFTGKSITMDSNRDNIITAEKVLKKPFLKPKRV